MKVLEEPPSYGVFLILSDNPEKLLPTVRSRCMELQLTAVEPNILRPWLAEKFPEASRQQLDAAIRRSSGYPGQAVELLQSGENLPPEVESFVRAYASRDALALTMVLVPMEKWKRDQILPILEAWKDMLQEGLACRSGMPAPGRGAKLLAENRSSKDLLSAVEILRKAIEYTQGNVSVAAVCGWLVHALKQ